MHFNAVLQHDVGRQIANVESSGEFWLFIHVDRLNRESLIQSIERRLVVLTSSARFRRERDYNGAALAIRGERSRYQQKAGCDR